MQKGRAAGGQAGLSVQTLGRGRRWRELASREPLRHKNVHAPNSLSLPGQRGTQPEPAPSLPEACSWYNYLQAAISSPRGHPVVQKEVGGGGRKPLQSRPLRSQFNVPSRVQIACGCDKVGRSWAWVPSRQPFTLTLTVSANIVQGALGLWNTFTYLTDALDRECHRTCRIWLGGPRCLPPSWGSVGAPPEEGRPDGPAWSAGPVPPC